MDESIKMHKKNPIISVEDYSIQENEEETRKLIMNIVFCHAVISGFCSESFSVDYLKKSKSNITVFDPHHSNQCKRRVHLVGSGDPSSLGCPGV